MKRAKLAIPFRPGKRKAGAAVRTKTLAHAAFKPNSFRGGRTSPSEGEASGGP
jgi:hypothetical protein